MKHAWVAFILLGLVACQKSPKAEPDCRLYASSGVVRLNGETLASNKGLCVGDRILVHPGASAEVRVPHVSMRLEAGAYRFHSGRDFEISAGELRIASSLSGTDGIFQCQSASANIRCGQASFILRVDAPSGNLLGKTWVCCEEGHVAVKAAGSAQECAVAPVHELTVTHGVPLGNPMPISPQTEATLKRLQSRM